MAIRIPILTSFDPKGLKQANAQFAKLQTSMGSLGRNFAAAGVVIAGAFAMIGRSLRDAADSERVLAQTNATLKSTGTTANGTAKQIAALASSLQKSTAFNDEAILSGQNLLLTFKGVQNQAGEGNDIFNQASTTMLDFARAMNTGPSEAAIKLGKALQDPTRGVTALRKSGVDFTKDQMEMIKALQDSGDLMGAQKIVLAELQSQFGGSAAAYAKTFTGQVESMNNELNDLSEEIGFMVMPAVTGFITELRALIPVIGPQLKAAIASVDFKALAKSVVDLTTFLITNADAIAKGIIAIFAISTAYKAMAVATGIAKLATDLYKYSVAQAAAGVTLKTVAVTKLSAAMRLIPFAAAVAGAYAVGTAYANTKSKIEKTTPALSDFNKEAIAVSVAAAELDPITKLFQKLAFSLFGAIVEAKGLKSSLNDIPKDVTTTINIKTKLDPSSAAFARATFDMGEGGAYDAARIIPGIIPPDPDPDPDPKGAAKVTAPVKMTLGQTLKREATVVRKQAKLIGAGVSEGLAARLTAGATPVKRANKALAAITKNNGKLTKNLRNMEKNLKVVADAAVEAVTAAEEPIKDTSVEDALAAKQRAYESFADAVKNTFGSIKDSILDAFNLTELGSSTNSITRNMDKMLVKLRSFASNVAKLSGLGLNSALLQQVISAGPMAGARLAENLVIGGAEGLAAINAGYSEFGSLAGQIATTGTNSLFNREAQQTVYNINVDGGVGSGSTIGKAIVDAIKAYERTSGAVWQGA